MDYQMVTPMGKKIATTIYITEEQQAKLKLLNEQTKVPVAEYIRQGIDSVLSRYSRLIPGQLDLPLNQWEALGGGAPDLEK